MANWSAPNEDGHRRLLSRPAVAIPLVGVLALIAGTVFFCSGPDKPDVLTAEPSPDSVLDGYTMICRKCQKRFDVPRAELTTWPQNEKGYQCPHCKELDSEPDNTRAAKMPEG